MRGEKKLSYKARKSEARNNKSGPLFLITKTFLVPKKKRDDERKSPINELQW